MSYQGIPSEITLEFVKTWVRPRTSDRRFRHVEGVVEVGSRLAGKADCDVFLAELSCWLHDACKEMKNQELVRTARDFGLELDEILETNGYLLHGPVAAEVAKRELGIANSEVYAAIAEHTLGAVPMSTLSKVVFLADCLESSRPEDYTAPIWKALDLDGRMNLDAAIVVASDQGLKLLIEDGKSIHPKTVCVRNFYLASVPRAAARPGI